MGPLTKELLAAHQIPLDRSIPLDSIRKFLPDPFTDNGNLSFYSRNSKNRGAPILPPAALKKKTRQLKKLRASEIWKSGTRGQQLQQMEEWFPDLPTSTAMQGVKMARTSDRSIFDDDVFGDGGFIDRDVDVDMFEAEDDVPDAPTNTTNGACPISEIGHLYKLPGELRNRIYRLSIVGPSEEPVKITLQTGTCSIGSCNHMRASKNLPGIASTCKQLRWEAAPIFFTENTAGFEFDDGTVQQCCVGNYLRSLGSYVDMIPQFHFLLKRPISNGDTFVRWATYRFTLLSPKKSESEEFELKQEEDVPQDVILPAGKICDCPLRKLVAEMNGNLFSSSIGDLVMSFVDSEEFADFVWRVKKTKQHIVHLKRCKQCREVIFNN